MDTLVGIWSESVPLESIIGFVVTSNRAFTRPRDIGEVSSTLSSVIFGPRYSVSTRPYPQEIYLPTVRSSTYLGKWFSSSFVRSLGSTNLQLKLNCSQQRLSISVLRHFIGILVVLGMG